MSEEIIFHEKVNINATIKRVNKNNVKKLAKEKANGNVSATLDYILDDYFKKNRKEEYE